MAEKVKGIGYPVMNEHLKKKASKKTKDVQK